MAHSRPEHIQSIDPRVAHAPPSPYPPCGVIVSSPRLGRTSHAHVHHIGQLRQTERATIGERRVGRLFGAGAGRGSGAEQGTGLVRERADLSSHVLPGGLVHSAVAER